MIGKMVIFYGEDLFATRPTHNLEDHSLSTVRDCLFIYSYYIICIRQILEKKYE